MNSSYSSVYEYYQAKKLNPTAHDVEKMGQFEKHERKRRNLFEYHLKLPQRLWKNARVLEIGCSSGENSLIWAKDGADISFVEPLASPTDRLVYLFKHFGLENRINKIHHCPLENFANDSNILYDIIIAEGFLFTLADRERQLCRMRSWLAKDGFIIISTMDPVGMFLEYTKRGLLFYLAAREGWNEDKQLLSLAHKLFYEDFQKIKHSRPFEAWIRDDFLNSHFNTKTFWGYPEIQKSFNPDFYLYSSWPNYREIDNLVWHKNVFTSEEIIQLDLGGYYCRAPHFIHGKFTETGVSLFEKRIGKGICDLIGSYNKEIDLIVFSASIEINPLLEQIQLLKNSIKQYPVGQETMQVFTATSQLFKKIKDSSLSQAITAYKTNMILRTLWGCPAHYLTMQNKNVINHLPRAILSV